MEECEAHDSVKVMAWSAATGWQPITGGEIKDT